MLLEPPELTTPCPLCDPIDFPVLWQNAEISVIDAQDPDYPGFCRVIWRNHQTEMSNLEPRQRQRIMTVVFAIEQVLIDQLNPDKINLASLGNQVAHIHWHVIPRYTHDRHFPDAIWAQPNRESPPQATLTSQQLQTWLKPALDKLGF